MQAVETNCRGVIMLRVGNQTQAASLNLGAATKAVLEQVVTSGDSCSRFLVRLIPLQVTCFAGLEEMMTAATGLLEEHFGQGVPNRTFMIAMKRRNNPGFDRDAAISRLAGAIGARHTVNMKDPERVLLVEVFQSFCGLSVLENFSTLRDYNIRQLQDAARERVAGNSSPAPAVTDEASGTAELIPAEAGGLSATAAGAAEAS